MIFAVGRFNLANANMLCANILQKHIVVGLTINTFKLFFKSKLIDETCLKHAYDNHRLRLIVVEMDKKNTYRNTAACCLD